MDHWCVECSEKRRSPAAPFIEALEEHPTLMLSVKKRRSPAAPFIEAAR